MAANNEVSIVVTKKKTKYVFVPLQRNVAQNQIIKLNNKSFRPMAKSKFSGTAVKKK